MDGAGHPPDNDAKHCGSQTEEKVFILRQVHQSGYFILELVVDLRCFHSSFSDGRNTACFGNAYAWSYCDRFFCVFQHIIPKPTIICFFKLKCNVSQFLGNDFPADITEMSLLSNDKFICKKTYKNNVVQTLWKLRFTQCHSSILCPLIKIQKSAYIFSCCISCFFPVNVTLRK